MYKRTKDKTIEANILCFSKGKSMLKLTQAIYVPLDRFL